MTGPLQTVKANLDPRCLVRNLNRQGCSLTLAGLPRTRIAIDLDSAFAPLADTTTRCDYLFLVEHGSALACAASIELKRGGFGARSVAAQLQAGADALAGLVPDRSPVTFRALVASGKFPKSERDPFKRVGVRFRGTLHRLFHTPCGSQLSTALRL